MEAPGQKLDLAVHLLWCLEQVLGQMSLILMAEDLVGDAEPNHPESTHKCPRKKFLVKKKCKILQKNLEPR